MSHLLAPWDELAIQIERTRPMREAHLDGITALVYLNVPTLRCALHAFPGKRREATPEERCDYVIEHPSGVQLRLSAWRPNPRHRAAKPSPLTRRRPTTTRTRPAHRRAA